MSDTPDALVGVLEKLPPYQGLTGGVPRVRWWVG